MSLIRNTDKSKANSNQANGDIKHEKLSGYFPRSSSFQSCFWQTNLGQRQYSIRASLKLPDNIPQCLTLSLLKSHFLRGNSKLYPSSSLGTTESWGLVTHPAALRGRKEGTRWGSNNILFSPERTSRRVCSTVLCVEFILLFFILKFEDVMSSHKEYKQLYKTYYSRHISTNSNGCHVLILANVAQFAY